MNNKEFGKLLATLCFNNNITKVPFILNEEQYNSFIKEYRHLEYNTDTSAGHPNKQDGDIVRHSKETWRDLG